MNLFSCVLLILGSLAAGLISDIFIKPGNAETGKGWDTLTGLLVLFGIIGFIVELVRG